MPSLFTIAEQFRALEKLTDDDVPPEVIADTLAGLEGDLEQKAVNIVKFAMNLESDAAAVTELSKQWKARAEKIQRKADHLRDYLKVSMEVVKRLKIEVPEFTISVRSNPPSVVIDDATKVPDTFKVTPEPAPPPVATPDKKLIADALKAHAKLVDALPEGAAIPASPVPGAHLEVATRLQVKV
jgi:Siphovirus Gp157